MVDARKPHSAGEWTPDELGLLQSLVDQLGVALDGAQLYQDAQERAGRERLLGDTAARVRQRLDVDSVLQTAVRAIGDSLGLSEVEARLGGASEADALDRAEVREA